MQNTDFVTQTENDRFLFFHFTQIVVSEKHFERLFMKHKYIKSQPIVFAQRFLNHNTTSIQQKIFSFMKTGNETQHRTPTTLPIVKTSRKPDQHGPNGSKPSNGTTLIRTGRRFHETRGPKAAQFELQNSARYAKSLSISDVSAFRRKCSESEMTDGHR